MKFEVLGEISGRLTIATGRGVHDRRRLIRQYGGLNWRKMKGRATVRLGDGTIIDAELHWYEAQVMGQFDVTACAASHSRDSIRSTTSSMDQSRSVTPAAIAGVQRMV